MNFKGRILRVRMTLVRDEKVWRDESCEETDRGCGEMRVRKDESCEETDRGCGGGSGLGANQTTGS